MQVTDEQLLATASLSFPADRFEFVTAMMKNQEIAAKVAYTVDQVLEPMVRGTRLTEFASAVLARRGEFSLEPMMRGDTVLDLETSRNWQADYDLVLGRLLAIKVRCNEYNWACACMKLDPPKFSNKMSNAWRLVRDEKIRYSVGAATAAREGKSLLKRVVDERPGSSWAFLAQRQLSSPFGFRWQETYVDPVTSETSSSAEPKSMDHKVDIITFYNYRSCGGFWPPSLRRKYDFQHAPPELIGGTVPMSVNE